MTGTAGFFEDSVEEGSQPRSFEFLIVNAQGSEKLPPEISSAIEGGNAKVDPKSVRIFSTAQALDSRTNALRPLQLAYFSVKNFDRILLIFDYTDDAKYLNLAFTVKSIKSTYPNIPVTLIFENSNTSVQRVDKMKQYSKKNGFQFMRSSEFTSDHVLQFVNDKVNAESNSAAAEPKAAGHKRADSTPIADFFSSVLNKITGKKPEGPRRSASAQQLTRS